MSVVAHLKPIGQSGFGYGSTAVEVTHGLDLSGRNILVTGCNSGLGLETARVLVLRGAKVWGAARTHDRARAACAGMGTGAVPIACELSDPQSIRNCIQTIKQSGTKLDGVICNAGIMALPKLEQAFGYELQFFTNHIGHFMLVTGLLEQLTERARIVIVSSTAHARAPKKGIEFDNLSGEKSYQPWTAYGQSKLANILFTRELAQRLSGTGMTANALHPGVIATNLGRSMPAIARIALRVATPIALKDVAQGAATQCYVATNPNLNGVTGEYFADCNLAQSTRISRDPALARRLWEESESIVAKLP
jgi:NAD(P)-dependent dehydrogenase (short-subunit alcohol dehydrogenase family)